MSESDPAGVRSVSLAGKPASQAVLVWAVAPLAR